MGVDTPCSTLQLLSTQALVVAPPCCKLVTTMYGQAAVHQADRCCGCTLAACRRCHRMQCCSQFVSLVWSVSPMAWWWWSSLSCCQWPSDSGHLQPCVCARGWKAAGSTAYQGSMRMTMMNCWQRCSRGMRGAQPFCYTKYHSAVRCIQVRAGQTKEGPGRELWQCLGT